MLNYYWGLLGKLISSKRGTFQIVRGKNDAISVEFIKYFNRFLNYIYDGMKLNLAIGIYLTG